MSLYEEKWQDVEKDSRAYRLREGSPILVWCSPAGERCCLIPCSAGAPVPQQWLSKKLRIYKDELGFDDRKKEWYAVVECADIDKFGLFDYLINELLHDSDPFVSLDSTIEKFQHFWSPPSRSFTGEDAVGLFGELWFLDEWLSADIVHAFRGWTGGDSRLHDFSWENATVEVKTTRKSLPATHRIGTLEQLIPQDGRNLFLFSFAVRQDAGAGNHLSDLIESIEKKLAAHGHVDAFNRFIAQRGYRPDDPNNESFRYIVREDGEHLYEVRDNFPRLIAASFAGGIIPSGVGGINYEITLSGYDALKSEYKPGFNAEKVFGLPL